jgi:glutaconate CoA-transferase subunit B
VFVSGVVDMVSGVGYRKERWPKNARHDYVDLRLIVTDLCVLDFGGPGKWDGASIRVKSLHPGLSFEQVQAVTGFPLLHAPDLRETPLPTKEQLAIIGRLDPHNLRATVIKNNPPAVRSAQAAA